MLARITWSRLNKLGQADVDHAVAFYRQRILPSLQTQDGFLGAVVLVNRETGDGSSVTYWRDAQAMAASDAMGAAARDEVRQAVGVQVTEVDHFEVLLQDRVAPVRAGTFVRANDLQAAPGQIDAMVTFLRDSAVPVTRSTQGYQALLILANRETGRMLIASVWDTAEARAASEAAVSGLRAQAAEIAQSSGVNILMYEGLLAEVAAGAQASTTGTTV